jgi:hypothetical protein
MSEPHAGSSNDIAAGSGAGVTDVCRMHDAALHEYMTVTVQVTCH